MDLPVRRVQRSSAPSPLSASNSDSNSDSDSSHSSSRSATPTQRDPFPTSLTKARALLSTAHVPLGEYMKLRSKDISPGFGAYAHLLMPSVSSLRKTLRSERKFARLDEVKEAWLNPLLKDFGFHKSRRV